MKKILMLVVGLAVAPSAKKLGQIGNGGIVK